MKYYKPKNTTILYLNTEWNCMKTASGSKNTTFTWNINNTILNDLGKISVFSVAGTGIDANATYVFRLVPNIQIESNNVFISDYSSPILFIYSPTTSSDNFEGIDLKPQVLNTISITVDDDIATKTGIANTIKLLIGIKIEERDVALTRIDNPYEEAVGHQMHKLF